ncbi:MAG: glycosyltransferase family 2 protein [Chloroflexi bacterium]|nr:glycosyltransferase family 2 protein [Chloroflexota bacterium]
MSRLSVVIVSWNTAELLRACLKSVLAELPADGCEVFVVDNASTDGSAAMMHSDFPAVKLIENAENVGFARANNLALRRAQGEMILLLNPDTEVKPGALGALLRFMAAQPGAGAAGARLLNADGSLQYSCSPAPTLASEARRLFHLPGMRPDGYYPMETWSLDAPQEVDVLLGACLLLRREALEQAGPMDEDYFMYSEEVDLCRRVQKQGWKLFWVPQAQVVHYGGQSTRQAAVAMFLRLYQGKVIYFRKHHGWLKTGLYKLLLAAAAISRMVLGLLARARSAEERQGDLAMADNYRRLLFALGRIEHLAG